MRVGRGLHFQHNRGGPPIFEVSKRLVEAESSYQANFQPWGTGLNNLAFTPSVILAMPQKFSMPLMWALRLPNRPAIQEWTTHILHQVHKLKPLDA
jgi:hypothetical protein